MKKQDIRNIYTQKIADLLNQGYTIFPDTMNGSQGEIAHIDLAKGSEIIRVLLEHSHRGWSETGYNGDTILLTVGRAEPNPRIREGNGIIWNSRLEPIFQIEWANIHGGAWFTDLETGMHMQDKHRARYKARSSQIYEELGTAYRCAALGWLRKQPRMKTCKVTDIQRMVRITNTDGKRRFEITAKGHTYILR